ncbi:MAG TPA: LysM peptidoglycan-binding domain-containing protein [Candidatus Competibacteraceae bacterium]|nr:LysM peptidoglycan-binding domain-containing protein [Candidatus Competibacteraceae bacterium]HQA25315.1 LysM peptidoglycan-binding domain-containing protein [Candidatus Competibacteraceae bacterium]HQD55360.1 LysM peptidoglycan-binding domain-containing protein [Candidatus Competibacteraceae bacterium]
MNITRSSRHPRIVLSLATTVLLWACAQTPPPQPESSAAPPGEPPRVAGPPAAGTAPPPLAGSSQAPDQAPAVALRPDHPQTYTVAPGDTLWSIARRFLQHPWQWREIWRQNPQIRNPNRIYPGDVLKFSYDANGKPQLEVAQNEEVPLLKVSPQVRTETLTQPIPPVPRDAIESFLTRAIILSDAQWQQAPYIVADDDSRLVYANGSRVYVRGATSDQSRYRVFRIGDELREPGSDRYLGTVGIYLGEAILEKDGDPATFTLTHNAVSPIKPGDRLIPFESEAELYNFDPHPVPPDTDGLIISQLNPDFIQITQYSSIIINLGDREGIQPGHVLAIYNKGREVTNPVTGGTVRLPGERSGLVMVYKVHDLVSYAIVMEAERAIHLQDRVTTP